MGRLAEDRVKDGFIPGSRFRNFSAAILLRRLQTLRYAFPAYVVAYRYRGRLFRTVISGQDPTRVLGQAPYSGWKIAGAIGADAPAGGAARAGPVPGRLREAFACLQEEGAITCATWTFRSYNPARYPQPSPSARMSQVAPETRILIVDAQPLYREGVRRTLEAEPDLGVVGETGDGDEAVDLVLSTRPDLLLLDPDMPRTDGFETLARLAGAEDRPSTILLTASLDRDQLVAAVRLGVRGVVSKDASGELILKAVRSVRAGQYWLGHEEVADVVRSLLRTGPPTDELGDNADTASLTPREREVVMAVVQGLSNREIAEHLKVSADTVKHHLTSVYDKMGVSSRVELVVYALSRGIASEA